MSREIPLTRGLVAIVDDEDYERLAERKWCARRMGARWYASRAGPRNGGEHGLQIHMHREILGVKPNQDVDHISGDGLDNRRENLRVATQSQNNANMRLCAHNTSGFKGVHKYRGSKPWRAEIGVAGRMVFLGHFSDLREAAEAYDRAALEHYGEFARTNKAMGLL